MRKNEEFQELSSRSSASSRSSTSSESSSDEEEKGIECFLENDQPSVEKDPPPVENDRFPVEPEVKLTDCKPLVLGEIDSESDDELNDQESLPVILDKPEFTSGVEFILSPTLTNEKLPVLDFFPKIESEVELQASMESENTREPIATTGPEVNNKMDGTTESEMATKPEVTTEPEGNTEPEIQLIERSSLVLANNESSGEESNDESDNFKQLPVLTFIQKVEPEILKISEAECEEELYPFVPTVDEFNNLVPLPVSNFKLSTHDEPEITVEQLEVESVGGLSLTARKSARRSSTDDELTDSTKTAYLLEKPEVSGTPEVANTNHPMASKLLPILSFIPKADFEDDSEVFDNLDSMNRLQVSERPEVSEKPEVRNADEPSSSAENGSCMIFARFFARCRYITFPLETKSRLLDFERDKL